MTLGLEYSVVGFLDILGFSAMVEADCNSSAPRFLPIFLEVFEELKDVSKGEGPPVRMYSDSIVIEAPLSPVNVVKVVEVAAELQRLFLRRKILVRGGIAFGKHYANDKVTFSQALVSAYHIESKIARFPRVIVDKHALSYAWHDTNSNPELRQRLEELLVRDRDQFSFVDFLNSENIEELSVLIRSCVESIAVSSETVLEKFRWLLDYHNYRVIRQGMPHLVSEHLASDFGNLGEVQ